MKNFNLSFLALGLVLAMFVSGMSKTGEDLPIFQEKHFNKPEQVAKALYCSFGGPDGYGYTWLNSDTIGGPVYNWIEISGIGTRIEDNEWCSTGADSMDDGTAGHFPIGFHFPFQCLIFDSVYIGTNGLISFTDSDLTCDGYFCYHENVWIPHMRFSNVLLAFFSDLNLNPNSEGGGDIYYWTNPNLDTLIVEYKNVKPFSDSVTTDAVTFQIILTTTDSSITYQYQSVVTTDSWFQGNLVPLDSTALIGIQDCTKYVGLRYYGKGVEGYQNMPHSGLAVKFKKTVEVMHNVLLFKSPISEGPYSWFNTHVYNAKEAGTAFPDNYVKVLNTGVYQESNIPVLCEILRKDTLGNETLVYSWLSIINSLLPGDSTEVYFANSWVPLERGKYWITYRTELPSDQVFSDDTTTWILLVERTLLNSPWATTVPSCNGIIEPGEWDDANKYDISRFIIQPFIIEALGGHCYDSNSAFIYVKNDSNYIYFAFDIPQDTTDTKEDGASISIDENNNRFLDADSSEGRITLINYFDGSVDSLYFRHLISDTTPPYYWASRNRGPFIPIMDWEFKMSNSSGHQQAEIAIPFGNSFKWEVNSKPGDTIGVFFNYGDRGDSIIYWGDQKYVYGNSVGYWPYTCVYDYLPTVFGRIYLCSKFTIPEIPTLVFPPNGEKGPTDQMFLWNPAGGVTSYQLQVDNDSDFISPIRWITTSSTGHFLTGLPDNETLWWRVRGVNSYGYGDWSDQWRYTDVKSEQKEDIPFVFSLNQNYPNPFNPSTLISYTLAEDCLVKIAIYNILGQKVKALVNEVQRAGQKIIRWDGKDNKGQEVASGVYFYRIEAKDFIQSKKMVVIR